MGCIGLAIKILEGKIEETDIYPIDSVVGAGGSEDGIAGPSSGFGIGSSSN